MKAFAWVLGISVLCAGGVSAEELGGVNEAVALEEVAVVNDPPNAWEEFRDAVGVIDPTVEAVYNVEQGEWTVGTSGSLYDFTDNAVYLGRIKAGYLASNSAYAGVDVDLPNLVARYLEGRWPQADRLLEAVAKYATVGAILGYDFDAEAVVYGPTFGATVRF